MLKMMSTVLVIILVDMPVLSYRGEPPTFPCLRKPEKEKGMVRLGLNFSLLSMTISFVVFCRPFVV